MIGKVIKTHEGRGFLLHTSVDTPFNGWLGVRQLNACIPIASSPWEAIRNIANLSKLMPGGLSLIWDAPMSWINDLNSDTKIGFIKSLNFIHGLTVHINNDEFESLIQEPSSIWYHSPNPPSGLLGDAWRRGWLGWVPEYGSTWSLPGLGRTAKTITSSGISNVSSGYIWGEVIIPFSALGHLDYTEIIAAISEHQGQVEYSISQRIDAEAWPTSFPFYRRRTGWRIAFLGGREFQLGGGLWENAAILAKKLAQHLETALRCPIYLASSVDLIAAIALGQQAMWEGLPWRNTLPLPPATPAFTVGFGADPRLPSPIETRSIFPLFMAKLLDEPPVINIRVPEVPTEKVVNIFLEGLESIPAINWLPPIIPPPGPFLSGSLWAPAYEYPPLLDTTQIMQPSLFDGID